MAAKKRALISVADKRFLTNLGRELLRYGYELVASGGTYKKLKEAGIAVKELSRLIKSPEILDGRVKTLHPAVHGGILADRGNPLHMKELDKNGIVTFDLVCVNFYPFGEKAVPGKTKLAAAIEHLDIGGPTMARAAAKNYQHVVVLTNIEQYRELSREFKENDGEVSLAYRTALAAEAFQATSAYEASIAAFFAGSAPKASPSEVAEEASKAQAVALPTKALDAMPEKLSLTLKREESLRYGENPHQQAARYSAGSGLPVAPFKVLQGAEMSYNNYHDASAAISAVSAPYSQPLAACVIKHQNPSGIAIGTDPIKTFMAARDADEESAFGGIVGLNFPVTTALALELRKSFFEVIVAPSFEQAARAELSQKKNLRLVQVDPDDVRTVWSGAPRFSAGLFGVFLQSYDVEYEDWDSLQVVGSTPVPEKLRDDVLTGLRYVRFLKSNAVAIIRDGVMVGAGLGQMSRVAATEIAIRNAGKLAAGSVLVSDGFFPFSDSVELAAKAKIGCVVSPAGSKRDMEVVAAANGLKLPLVFTTKRHFLH
jgi:phosphoribosylaminoimidazolecarboxamide formyltransferase / IMP cyclohydrolase